MNKFLLVFFSYLMLSSCSVATRVDYENSEGALAEDFLNEVRKDKTDTDWIMANLGEPIYAQELESEASVYTWQLSRAYYKHASLLIIFRYNTVKRETEYLHVVSVDGLVKKHWLDRSAQIQNHLLDDFN